MGSTPGNKPRVVAQVEAGTFPHYKEEVLITCMSILQSNFAFQASDTLQIWNPHQPAKSYSHQESLEEYYRREKVVTFTEQWIERGVGWPFP